MQVVAQTWTCVANVVIIVERLFIKRIQQKVIEIWVKDWKIYGLFVGVKSYDSSNYLESSFYVALNGEKIRTKKKELPPNSSSKARQGQSRKKVDLLFDWLNSMEYRL